MRQIHKPMKARIGTREHDLHVISWGHRCRSRACSRVVIGTFSATIIFSSLLFFQVRSSVQVRSNLLIRWLQASLRVGTGQDALTQKEGGCGSAQSLPALPAALDRLSHGRRRVKSYDWGRIHAAWHGEASWAVYAELRMDFI